MMQEQPKCAAISSHKSQNRCRWFELRFRLGAGRPISVTPAHGSALGSAINAALDGINIDILSRSGSVFYSRRSAFARPAPLYLLGVKPGGDPERQVAETVSADLGQFSTTFMGLVMFPVSDR